IRACLEAYDEGLVDGVKDLGGGGLATASGELVHAGGFGSVLHLDRVPLRERGLLPWEIWISESQERMLLDVAPRHVERLLAVFRKHDVPATVVGEVVRGHSETLRWNGDLVGHLELGFRVDPPPARRRLAAPKLGRRSAGTVPESDIGALFEELVLAPDSRSREPILRLYDHEVRGRSVLTALHGRVESPAHGDAAVLAVEPGGPLGLAVAVAAQPATCDLDPAAGAALTVEELARNLYAVGARPDAFTNCLNFGNPEEPRVLGAFAATVRALAGAARTFGFAVPSGNVSFYNGGLGSEIPPTPVLFGVGIVPDTGRTVSSDLKAAGNPLYLFGPSRPELGGSLYARLHPSGAWAVPLPDARGTRRRGERLLALGRAGLLRSVHDLSDGGLAVTLAEMAFGGGLGFDVDLASLRLPSAAHALVAEGGSRWLVEVDAAQRAKFERATRGEPRVRVGTVVAGAGRLREGERTLAEIDLAALYPRWRAGPLETAPVAA
ncbi:MAG TPA: AIR synthase-related protein, partial [Thermoplasmata archaeon]|nr:AIR synthase-related protein [Thermoplasmata archaeon]